MKKLVERLLLFFVGIPLIIASVFFLPQFNYLVLHIELLFFCALAILEMHALLGKRMAVLNPFIAVCIGMFIPLAGFLYSVLGLPFRVITFSISLATLTVLFIEFFLSFSGKFDKVLERISTSFIMIMYPGYLVMYLSIMTVWKNAGSILSVFFLMVFACDSFAWLFGMLLGKNNRGLLPASPNKSIAGFIGGYIGSVAAAITGTLLFPSVFSSISPKLILVALATATAAIVGDIIESVMKRSAGLKDSGAFIPGRGGVLDSIDSILLAAPVYYILCDFFFGFGL